MIDFLKYRYVCFFASLILLSVGSVAYVMRGGFKYHIDFVGGSEIRIAFNKPIEIKQLRSSVDNNGWEGGVIQSLGDGSQEFLVYLGDATSDVSKRFSSMVRSDFSDNEFTIRSVEQVGAAAGKEVRWNTVLAILCSLLGLLLYISLRYKYAYAVGAVTALGHDLLVLMAYFVVVGEPISLNIIAGILTVLGYSLNDTIVVYSRIRENVASLGLVDRYEIVNRSLNQTLTRTLLTSFTTFMAACTMFFFGGDVLRGLSVTMMIAVIVGTYSSIYIASPVMLALSPSQEL